MPDLRDELAEAVRHRRAGERGSDALAARVNFANAIEQASEARGDISARRHRRRRRHNAADVAAERPAVLHAPGESGLGARLVATIIDGLAQLLFHARAGRERARRLAGR